MEEIATLLVNDPAVNWEAILSMLGVMSGIATLIGVLIANLVVKPMIDKLFAQIQASTISREVFEIYRDADHQEHQAMHAQLNQISRQINHEGRD